MGERKTLIKSIITAAAVILVFSGCRENNRGKSDNSKVLDEKPVIYLYGYDNTDVTISLSVNGSLTMTYPVPSSQAPGTATWKIKGVSDGNISTMDGNKYRYLFWEGESGADYSFEKGFCIPGGSTVSFLETKLKSLGLSAQETEDFVTYWGPRMKDNPYNVISFQTKTYTEAARLTVNPKPDTTLRIFMAWHPSNTNINIPAQTFRIPARKGKILVEWGGAEIPDEEDTVTIGDIPGQMNLSPLYGTGQGSMPVQQPSVPADPYAQYGTYAACAKAWDSVAAPKCGQTWAQLDSGTRQAAYNHWLGHGTDGW